MHVLTHTHRPLVLHELPDLPTYGLPPALRGLVADASATPAVSPELQQRIASTLVNGPAMGHDDTDDLCPPIWPDTVPMPDGGRGGDDPPPPVAERDEHPPQPHRHAWQWALAVLGIACAAATAWVSSYAPWGWGVTP